MNWYPNVDAVMFLLQHVWRPLKRLRPELTLDVAGANPPRAIVETARSLADVRVHGFVRDVRPMMDAAALIVCPIRDGGGTKLKILDAFAMQKCVLAHPIACEGIDVTADANVVFAVEPEEWLRRIDELLGDVNAARDRNGGTESGPNALLVRRDRPRVLRSNSRTGGSRQGESRA